MWSYTFLDESGQLSFNAIQNYGSSSARVFYYIFDVMILAGKDVMNELLTARRELLRARVLAKLGEPIRATLPDLIRSVKAQSFEGLVAKQRDRSARTPTWFRRFRRRQFSHRPELRVCACGQIVLHWLVATAAGQPARFRVPTLQIHIRGPAAMARAQRSDEVPRRPGRIRGWPMTVLPKEYGNGALVTDRRPCTLGRK
jgi:hypothetical protein